MSDRQSNRETEQRPWWEEGCYCPSGACVCGTEQDPFRIDIEHSERWRA